MSRLKLLSLLLVVVLLGSLAACGPTEEPAATEAASSVPR